MKNEDESTRAVRSYCLMCGVRCPVECLVRNGRLQKVRPDLTHPLGGTFCTKGASAPELVYDEARLKYPMKRTNPKTSMNPGWVRITWEEALDTIARKLLEIRSKYGPESVAFYRPAPGGSASADYHLWLIRFANAFGSPNYTATTHICQWHRDSGSKYTYGVGLPDQDYDNSGCIIVWGTNPSSTDVRHALNIKKAVRNGAKLIIVDPRNIPLIPHASLHLNVKPGTDQALALGLINLIINRDLYDKEFVTRWTNAAFLVRQDNNQLLTAADIQGSGSKECNVFWDISKGKPVAFDISYTVSSDYSPGLDKEEFVRLKDGQTIRCASVFRCLRKIASEYTPSRTSEITSIPEQEIRKAVDLIASSRPVSYYTYNGIEQHKDAMQTNRALCILYSLIGDFDRKGGNVIFPDLPLNDVSGLELLSREAEAKRLGCANRPLGPSGMAAGGSGAIQAYEVYESILTGLPYRIHALFSLGGNMIISNPDTQTGIRALQNLDFYVHVDLYENPTSKFADILLPAASSWESEFVGKFEWRDHGYIQMRHGIVKPEFERSGDLEILFDLAVRLELGEKFFDGNIEMAFNYMLKPLGKTVAELRDGEEILSIELAPVYEKYKKTDIHGKPAGFSTTSGLIEIYSKTFAEYGYDPLPRYSESKEANISLDYPLYLTACKPIQFTHGSYRSIPSLRKQIPEPIVMMNPVPARKNGIRELDWVLIETPKASARARAVFNEKLNPQIIVGQEGWWQSCESLGLSGYDPFSENGSNLNRIIGYEVIDRISGSVDMRGVRCRIRPLLNKDTIQTLPARAYSEALVTSN